MSAIRNNIVVTLSTRGHEQDVQAMLELYSDIIDPTDPQTDQKTTQSDGNTTQTTTQNDQKTTQRVDDTTQSNQKTTNSEFDTTQTEPQTSRTVQEQIINELRRNPNLSRKYLAKLIPSITEDGIKYHLKKLQEKGLLRRMVPTSEVTGKFLVKIRNR